MKTVIYNLFEYRSGRYIPSGLNILEKLWWRFVPGVTITVRWPRGEVIVDHNHPLWEDMGGAVWVNLGVSADPNDHYRPYLEKHIGKQGWDWNWGLVNDDIKHDRLTIKVRRKHGKYATMLAVVWS